jgi:hypothetical protein
VQDILDFDPLMSTLDDIDFYDIDDGPFEGGECPLDIGFPRLTVAQPSPSSPKESPKHAQSRQQHPQLQLQTGPLLSTPSSSTTSESYEDLNSELGQTAGTPSSSTDSIPYWTMQLEELSRSLHKSPILLDRMLHHSSQLLPRIRDALKSPHSADITSSSTRLILILMCLTQTVTLFEQCVPSVLTNRSTTGSSDVSLLLGQFQVDRKAQQALQMHIVSKEVSSMLHVSKLIRQTLLRPEWRNISKRIHELLLEDLHVRIVTLGYQMKHKWVASRITAS